MPAPRRSPFVVAAVVVVLDQITKSWAVNALANGRIIDVWWTLRFSLGFNSGMAFSRATGYGPLIGVIATVAVVWLSLGLRRADSFGSAIGVALVTGGAAGNLLDRIFRGRGWLHGSVVDFIDLQWWPVFNIADSAITAGGIILVAGVLFSSRSSREGRHDGIAHR